MRQPGSAALERTVARYRGGRRFARHYVASKVRTDPVHEALLELAHPDGFGTVVDVGCGRGQIAVALLEARLADAVLGLDWAGGSLDDARRAAGGLAFTARPQNLAQDASVPPCDTVLIIDVLYTMGREPAFRLLRAAVAAAGRRVVVRSLDAQAGWRGRFALAVEHLGRPIWPHAGARVQPLRLAELCGEMQAGGLATRTEPCWRGTPFANVLVIGTRVSAT